jgi:hypothetical protein
MELSVAGIDISEGRIWSIKIKTRIWKRHQDRKYCEESHISRRRNPLFRRVVLIDVLQKEEINIMPKYMIEREMPNAGKLTVKQLTAISKTWCKATFYYVSAFKKFYKFYKRSNNNN